jgi:hypothetical protein
MEAAIELHQLSEVRSPIATLAMLLPFARPLPQSFLQHPAPQCLGVNVEFIFAGQVLGGQRRPETCILFFHLAQDLLAFLLWTPAVGHSASVAVLQARRFACR